MKRRDRGRSRLRLLTVAAGGLLVALLVLIFTAPTLIESRIERQLERRLRAALSVDSVGIDSIDLNLWSGSLAIRGVLAERDDGGSVRLRVKKVDVRLTTYGRALFDSDPVEVRVDEAQLQLSAAGVMSMPRSPLSKGLDLSRIVLENSRVDLSPSSLMPGLGRVRLEIVRTEAEDVSLRDLTSWLQGTVALDATLKVPGGHSLRVDYSNGALRVGGGMLGSEPVVIPFAFPISSEKGAEVDYLASLARTLIRKVGSELVKRRLKNGFEDAKAWFAD